jgi:hypothetical protein
VARDVIRALVDRGREEGAFRADLPAGWLVTAALALIHGAAEEVRAGSLDERAALEALLATIDELLTGRGVRNPERG